jgi:hypothetical protein
MFEKTLKTTHEGVEFSATFKNTVYGSMRYKKFVDLLLKKNSPSEESIFCVIAGYIVEVSGLDWKIPDLSVDAEALRESYIKFIQTVPYPVMFKFHETAVELSRSIANIYEKPEAELTDEQLNDPN